ncbi:MAG: sulfatase-like hydrolase/transferase, partial [Myxococcota bacterium]
APLAADGFCAPLSESDFTLAEAFRQAGYRTVGVTANFWLTPEMGMAQGFETWKVVSARPGAPKQYALGQQVVTEAIDQLGQVLDEPFFGFINLMDAHAPYDPEPGAARFSSEAYRRLPLVRARAARQGEGLYSGDIYSSGLYELVNLEGRMPEESVQQILVSLYDDEIGYVDAQLGRIVGFLQDRGRLDETILVVAGDHGEAFFSHGLVNHGIGVHEETLRVPMLVRYPPRVAPGRVEDRVELIDVFPTLLRLAGVRELVSEELRTDSFGIDLLDPAARKGGRAALAESYYNGWERKRVRPELLRTTRAVVLDGWKYIDVRDGPGEPELYDLREDPDEQNDLFGSTLGAAARDALLRELERLSSGRAATWRGPAELSPEQAERLRRLGYLEEK